MKKKRIIKNIFRNYKKSFDYIQESKKFILAIVIIFIFFSFIGFFFPAPPQIEEGILDFIKELIEKTKDMSQQELTSFIFFNNLQSSFFGMILGILFGIFPLFTAIINGYLLGFVAAIVVQTEGILSLWRILPHGIFELPAVLISLGLGLKLSTFIFKNKKIKTLKKYFKESLRTFVLIIIPLLIIAAIIESILIILTK